MYQLRPTLFEVSPPKDPVAFNALKRSMIEEGVGDLLGVVQLGGEQRARLYVEPEGLSRASGGELYSPYWWTVQEPPAQTGQQG